MQEFKYLSMQVFKHADTQGYQHSPRLSHKLSLNGPRQRDMEASDLSKSEATTDHQGLSGENCVSGQLKIKRN